MIPLPPEKAGADNDLNEKINELINEKPSEEQVEQLKRNKVKHADEMNFLGLQAARKENGDLHTTLLIRNGCKDNIQLEQLPLHIEDATGAVVVKGAFTLPNLEIKANTTKPWSFVFPASSILKEDMDLSSWKALVPQD
ncbi:SLAP domain-containing protein [Bacillus sp. D-CC]